MEISISIRRKDGSISDIILSDSVLKSGENAHVAMIQVPAWFSIQPDDILNIVVLQDQDGDGK